MKKFKIYLAGKMSGLSLEEMNGWRIKATDRFNNYERENVQIETFNPCFFYNFDLNPETYTEKEVKRFDLYHVKSSDIVLFNLDHPNSIGSAIEIHMAHDEWKIPVIAFGTTINHPWMMESIDKVCETMEDAIDYIFNFYI